MSRKALEAICSKAMALRPEDRYSTTRALADDLERWLADEDLRKSERHFRSLIENVTDVIIQLDVYGVANYVSPSIRPIFGYRPEDWFKQDVFKFVHADDRAGVIVFARQATQQPGIASVLEFRLQHQDGSWRIVEALANNLLDDPAVRGVVVNLRDITERKRGTLGLVGSLLSFFSPRTSTRARGGKDK